MLARGAQLAVVVLALLANTGCLEHFARLETTVRYDPFEQQFEVERVLRDVSPAFFGCVDLNDCTEAIGRAVTLQPAAFPTALSDRLVQRLLESGAVGASVELIPDGDRLDARIVYRASVGSAAAEDTMVRAEYDGKKGYYLVVDADASLEPLTDKFRVRKTAMAGPEGIDWRESWVLRPKDFDVTTEMNVDASVRPMFTTIAGLGDSLAAQGWLAGGVASEPVLAAVQPTVTPDLTPVSVSVPVPVSAPVPASVPSLVSGAPASIPDAVGTDPVLALEAQPAPAPTVPPPIPPPASTRAWPAPDPTSVARTYIYDARVSGGGISTSAANVSAEPLLPRVKVCYQEAVARDSAVAGSGFLSALVGADGALLGTSVYGTVNDPALMRCLELAIQGWRFNGWGGGEGVSDVAIPLVFRVEAAPEVVKGKRKRR